MEKPRSSGWQYVKRWGIPFSVGSVFVFLAGRIAFGSAFLLPYDEGFHLGVIKIYAQHLNPFLASQPAGGDVYGALARDPSYLYHYILSFPYRIIEKLIPSEIAQVYILRGISIALGLLTLYLVYRLARRLGLSKLGAQAVSLSLAVTPVFYDVSAQINYDNLLFPCVLGSVLLALSVVDRLRAGVFPVQRSAALVSLVALSSLVKFSYLPIGLALVIYVGWELFRNLGRNAPARLREGLRPLGTIRQVLLVTLVVVSSIAWVQRYGVNLAKYHDPAPDCAAVLSAEQCSLNPIWARDSNLKQTVAERPANTNPLHFTLFWGAAMYHQLFTVLHNTTGAVDFQTQQAYKQVLRALLFGGVACALLSLGAYIKQQRIWLPVVAMAGTYVLVLWVQNYAIFTSEHLPIAIQGRYLLPILPLVYMGLMRGYELAASRLKVEAVHTYVLLSNFVMICWLAAYRVQRIGKSALRSLLHRPTESPGTLYYEW